MSKLSIKVVLAGRNYPLTINEDEETRVREAVQKINNSIKRLQENYAVKDMQDLLAMTALQLASQNNEVQAPSKTDDSEQLNELLIDLKKLSEEIDA